MRTVRRAVIALVAILGACGGLQANVPDLPGDGGLPEASSDATTSDVRDAATDSSSRPDARRDAEAGTEAGLDAGPDASVDPILVKFAVLGDYGNGGAREVLVADLLKSWSPEFIITVGDNDYLTPHDYDLTTGKPFHSYVAPYAGGYGAGAVENAFFPAIGNHDWDVDDGAAFFDFFTLPNNERYYELDKGPVHFVFLDSDTREPDGTTPTSTQGAWAQAAIAASAAPFQFVVFHHPAYTSGGRTPGMDWPFKTWGADVVLTGHVHNYERLKSPDGLQYFVVGQGGVSTAGFGAIHPSSELRYNANDGAQLVEVGANHARLRYYAVGGTLIDDITIDASGARLP